MRGLVAAGVAVLLAGAAAPASAHVQVTPATAATNDGVLFTVLVPNEKSVATTAVELKVPAGAIPYGFEDPPGWKHETILAPNKAVDRVRWTGRLPVGDFVRLVFLAGTPGRPTTLVWKAIQTYADGSKVRWIGAPDSDTPASRTAVVSTAARQGAGGEVGEPAAAGAPRPPAAAARPAAAVVERRADWVARSLGALALLALVADVVARRARPRSG